jgi:hypothetical protein
MNIKNVRPISRLRLASAACLGFIALSVAAEVLGRSRIRLLIHARREGILFHPAGNAAKPNAHHGLAMRRRGLDEARSGTVQR